MLAVSDSAMGGGGGFYLASFCAGRRAPWASHVSFFFFSFNQTGQERYSWDGPPAGAGTPLAASTRLLSIAGPGEGSGIDRPGVDTQSKSCRIPDTSFLENLNCLDQTRSVKRSGSPESPSPSSDRYTQKSSVQIRRQYVVLAKVPWC